MNLKVLTLRPDPDTGELDDEALQAFQASHEVTHVVDHFYLHDGVPSLALLLTWRPRPEAEIYGPGDRASATVRPRRAGVAPSGDGTPWSDQERVIFEALRRWRFERARRDGVPKHTVLPNRTFEAMIRQRPASKGALAAIPGIGPAKLAAYGDELLALLSQFPAGAAPNPEAPAGEGGAAPPPAEDTSEGQAT